MYSLEGGSRLQFYLYFLLCLKENSRLLQERGVAYINADSSIEGEYLWFQKKRYDCVESSN